MRDDDDHDTLGPALGVCTPQERRFVRALFDDVGGRGLYARAAKAAGYSASSTANLSRAATKLRQRPRVVAAIAEMAKMELRNRAPDAVRTVGEVMRRGKAADRLKAARTILERVDPTEQRVQVDVDVEHHISDADIANARARIEELARRAGLLPAPAIDAEFVVVKDADDDAV